VYPNPQDVLPLPPSPDIEQYRKRAKDLVKACRSGEEPAYLDWALEWLHDLDALRPTPQPPQDETRRRRDADGMAGFARERLQERGCALAQAQFVIARTHGFRSWPTFVQHLELLARPATQASRFERAADAIVAGDVDTIDRLIDETPGLVHERSARVHEATLLHYVSANGVENYRQRSPANMVDVARRLLDAGADVDAEADVYGGGATTLGLVLTSTPPRQAGVQLPLADLLLSRGARVDRDIVRSSLMNGCPEAAGYMAERGALVDLEGAAGTGRTDLVAQWLDHHGAAVESGDLAAALITATWYDRFEVIELLLDRGVDVGVRHPDGGETALHTASYEGNPRIVELLLERGAPVDAKDTRYDTSPFVWALHALLVEGRSGRAAFMHSDAGADERYRAVLTMLARAGASVDSAWLGDTTGIPTWLQDLLQRRRTGS
jgi:hypothetical protein